MNLGVVTGAPEDGVVLVYVIPVAPAAPAAPADPDPDDDATPALPEHAHCWVASQVNPAPQSEAA